MLRLSAVGPQVRVDVDACRRDASRCSVRWRITNLGRQWLRLEDAWIPHGRFRGDGHVPLSVEIAPGQSTRLELTVSASEPPGTIVENAFLILRVRTTAGAWRVFARMRIEFDAHAEPVPIVETVTAQSLQ
jgi:hypothetical protein